MNKYVERIYNGIVKENPTFIIMLGMCPTLAVTTSGNNGLYMGLTTTVVLAASNLLISALRKAIPDKVRIPAYIVIVASLVTIVQLLLEAYLPAVNELLGIYIPLIVVNCIILGRAEAYAAKNSIGLSLFDGIGMGLGFSVALTIIGSFRELLGAGTIFGFRITPESLEPISIFILAPGALFTLAILTALQNKLKLPSATNGTAKNNIGCGGDCSHCGGNICTENRDSFTAKDEIASGKAVNKATVVDQTKKQEKED
ncbi:electron transport complex subunit E [Lachnospiraceae bacterium MD1]|jgi:electron transport complex protein RnfE|uniref:Ion-translocating oxidoreductase complex subunit E n=1 Tax=Variimorphobacter saccharofermentans TaxID=2755051 RepID=A0A839K6N2_9FIRM|nr:electron transport complex subunit E [Variimorphobacter saccharofermentans]MBB2184321.1 electron transport complex subunit E [Variimorphobacter saccharofermentans]